VRAIATAGAGFLLAVLWFDLMFDVQVARYLHEEPPEPVIDSIATYYRRVTTDARPMNRLIALVMLVTLVVIAVQVVRGDGATAARWACVVLALVPIAVAGRRTVPSAQRLGLRKDPVHTQAALARAIYRQHLLCLGFISMLLLVELIWMR
jgi:hypothetical protein